MTVLASAGVGSGNFAFRRYRSTDSNADHAEA